MVPKKEAKSSRRNTLSFCVGIVKPSILDRFAIRVDRKDIKTGCS